MMSNLRSLTQETDKKVAALDALQDGVQQDTAVVEDLLAKGQAAQEVDAKKKDFISPNWGNLHITATI